jgi:hypothetical protein
LPLRDVTDQYQAASGPGQRFSVEELHVGVGDLDLHVSLDRDRLGFASAAAASAHHRQKALDRVVLEAGRRVGPLTISRMTGQPLANVDEHLVDVVH